MKIARVVALSGLGFLAFTACVGAIPLIVDPSGRSMQMPLRFLDHSPFHSYLIPGLILLCANGALSVAVMTVTFRRVAGFPRWVTLQGCVLAGWITVEVIMVRSVIWAHYLYWGLAAVLIVCGRAMAREKPPSIQS